MREVDSIEYYIMRLEEELNDLHPDDPEIKVLEDEINRLRILCDNIKKKIRSDENEVQ